MTTNRQRQRRQRNSMIFHVILFLLLLCAIVAVTVIGIRWLGGPTDSGTLPAETAAAQNPAGASRETDQTVVSQETGQTAESETSVSVEITISSESTDGAEGDNLFTQMAGTWHLDGVMTNTYLEENGNEYHSLREMFGTGIQEGHELVIQEDGSIKYYIGIGNGGTGQGEISGDEVKVTITPYEDHSSAEEILTLHLELGAGQTYVVMDYYGEKLYWTQVN